MINASLSVNKDGGFVVRDSKHGGQDSPYTLTVYNNNKVFNINIRTRPDGKIALGKEKVDEQVFQEYLYTPYYLLN